MDSPELRVSINKLPLEIMLDILSRVPAESVLECKCVSKPWRNLVQHPSLSKMHLNHLNNFDSGKLSFLFYTNGVEKQFSYADYDENLNRFSRTIRMNLRPPFKNYFILNSCNGLICFNKFDDNYCGPTYVCNPITREFILLPKPKSEGKECLSGFGYSPSTDEYKVVRIVKSRTDPGLGILLVYTLGRGIGWRNVGKMNLNLMPNKQRGVYLNGAIHWINLERTIFAFNLEKEEFHRLSSLPSLPQAGNFSVKLQVLGDFLCAYYYVYIGGYWEEGYWDIWFLKKNRNNQDVIWKKECRYHRDVTPITFTKNGELLFYDRCDRNVYRSAQEASSSRMFVNVGEIFKFGVPHQNTLVSLKALGEKDTKLMDSGESARSSRGRYRSDH